MVGILYGSLIFDIVIEKVERNAKFLCYLDMRLGNAQNTRIRCDGVIKHIEKIREFR